MNVRTEGALSPRRNNHMTRGKWPGNRTPAMPSEIFHLHWTASLIKWSEAAASIGEESSSRKDSQKKKKVKVSNNFQSRSVLETIVLHPFSGRAILHPKKMGAFTPAINGPQRCIPASFGDLLVWGSLALSIEGEDRSLPILVHQYVLLLSHFNKMWPVQSASQHVSMPIKKAPILRK